MVSATLPVAAAQGPLQMTVRPARHLVPNFIKVFAPKTAPPVLSIKLKLRSVKVSLSVHAMDMTCLELLLNMDGNSFLTIH